nr:vWA domain-containing protein [Haloplanus rubicundus]
MAVIDTSQSITGELDNAEEDEEIDLLRDAGNELIRQLQARATGNTVQAGVLTFNGGQDEGAAVEDPTVDNQPVLRADIGPLDQFDIDSDGDPELADFLPNTGFGDTPMPHAIDLGQKILQDQGRSGARKVILLVTDGLPDYTNDLSYTVTSTTDNTVDYTSESYPYSGSDDDPGQDETADEADEIKGDGIEILGVGIDLDVGTGESFLINRVVGVDTDPNTAEPNFFVDASFDTFVEDAETVAQRLVGGDGECDEVIFSGSLGELETALTANGGRGLPLDGDRGTPFDELNGSESSENRECFSDAVTNCFGLAWWLPENHGNEVQSDSVSFDLGFYTEQCRHNDGSGMNNENVDA